MEQSKKTFYKKWWFWLIIFFLLVGIFGSQNETQKTNNIENTNAVESNKQIVFLKDTNGKEFFNILCEVAELEKTNGIETGDTIDYETSNMNYSIELETNKNGEINYIRMMALQSEDYTNFFVALSRLEYNGSNRSTCFNWINDNLGKEAKTKIGDANIQLSLGTNKNLF